ncbi:g5863 [Coccomyxa elongata]
MNGLQNLISLKAFQKQSASAENPLADDPRYEKIRSLGRGSFGFVQLATDKRTKEKVAVKFWPRIPEYITVDVQRELHNHSRFRHPHIIQFREVFLTPTHLGLAMEVATAGDLFKRVKSCKGLAETEARMLFQQLLLAVDYCHKMGVANRDIKLENVLLSGRKPPYTIKLTDFGFCKRDCDSIPTTMCGTLGYMAPEVMSGGSYNAKSADVWSCGVMLFVMFFGEYPFADVREVMLGEVQFPEQPAASEAVKDLILRMTERNPVTRIKLEDVCSQAWVAQGLPENYLAKNDEYIRAAEQEPQRQSIEEIDRLLLEAGLQLPKPSVLHTSGVTLVQRFSRQQFERCRPSKRLPFSYLTVRMVEGHQCHRVVHAHRKVLLGQRFKAESPNGKFIDGAKAINQQLLNGIECHGKNLFYFFGEGDDTVVLHVHFGMSGAFRTLPRGDAPPETTPNTRLLLTGERIVALLSAMIVQHGSMELYEEKLAKLGPDPLREDADKERLWEVMQKSKKSIGQLLMDQTAVAGIGNIYRAEILFKAGVHPEEPGRLVDRASFELIWRHSVDLLQRGFKSGSILTVDPHEAKVLGPPWQRRYIYNHKSCGRCGSPILTWIIQSRTCYACVTCQPLQAGTELAPERAKILASATGTKVFQSHCAPEPPAAKEDPAAALAKLTVAALKVKLQELDRPLTGRKADLVERLAAALQAASAAADGSGEAGEEGATEDLKSTETALVDSLPEAQPGTACLGRIATAEEAALEKARAGEGRNVEHVALETKGTLELAAVQSTAGAKRSPRRAAAAKVKMEASGHAAGALKEDDVPAAEPVTAGGKLTMRKRRAASGPGRSTRSKVATQSDDARGIGLDVPYKWGNPQ